MRHHGIAVGLWALAGLRLVAAGLENNPQYPPLGFERAERSPITSFFVAPKQIVWQSDAGVQSASSLLQPHASQAVLSEPQPPCELSAVTNAPASVRLDFGRELHGGVELFTTRMPEQTNPSTTEVRVRFGKSVSEAMAELAGPQNAGNDHAIRDQMVTLPWLGKQRVGPSEFRFVRLDNLDPDRPVQISQIRAVLQIRDLPQIGSFKCDDERLNRIWQVGADTVHLNMQEYLWDGIKRDRLVWLGDIRRYKGARPLPPVELRPLQIGGCFDDWKAVGPEFRDTIGDPVHRKHAGWDGSGPYVNETGPNDLIAAKVSADATNVDFYVRTAAALSAPSTNWMHLYIDADGNHTNGWLGYDFVVNRTGLALTNGLGTSTVERNLGGYAWGSPGTVPLHFAGNELELAIPRAVLGTFTTLDFKWADNILQTGNWSDFTLNGDAAPSDRFNYRVIL